MEGRSPGSEGQPKLGDECLTDALERLEPRRRSTLTNARPSSMPWCSTASTRSRDRTVLPALVERDLFGTIRLVRTGAGSAPTEQQIS